MTTPIQFPGEEKSNQIRARLTTREPIALRTFTPTQAVLDHSAGVFHWQADGRQLYDFTSGVLVANLGHNPTRWFQRFTAYMKWPSTVITPTPAASVGEFFPAVALTAYNAMTPLEAEASDRLVRNIQASPGGHKLNTVMWAASGSEAVQKALWACLHRNENRDIILATRYGFHGKKGLAEAVTGSETDKNRDPRVRFISFPMAEYDDVSRYQDPFQPEKYLQELEELWRTYGTRINCLITEPYLGGGGSYHPAAAYHQLLEKFCREHDIIFIFDEVQANFGRTGRMYAFEAYGIAPDMVVLGKGLGNGVAVSATVGRGDIMASLKYGEASDTWSANPLSCASVLATLDEFESTDVLDHTRKMTPIFLAGLNRLKETGLIAKVRGEGMVFGIQCAPRGELTDKQIAIKIVEACYLGRDGIGIHLLGALAGNVIRVSPPLVITEEQARASMQLMFEIVSTL